MSFIFRNGHLVYCLWYHKYFFSFRSYSRRGQANAVEGEVANSYYRNRRCSFSRTGARRMCDCHLVSTISTQWYVFTHMFWLTLLFAIFMAGEHQLTNITSAWTPHYHSLFSRSKHNLSYLIWNPIIPTSSSRRSTTPFGIPNPKKCHEHVK